MRSGSTIVAALVCVFALSTGAQATALRVAPTTVSLTAPDSASVLSLHNDDDHPINVQIRLFRWTQVDGIDRLEPTRDVVASPPAVTLPPGATTLARIVRVTNAPVAGEESYRMLVDELPDPMHRQAGSVALVLRYSIPVFFVSPEARPAALAWSTERRGKQLILTGLNSGDRHVRIADLSVSDAAGRTATLGDGLAGYLLGGSNMRWPLGTSHALAGRSLTVTAMSETGQINAPAPLD